MRTLAIIQNRPIYLHIGLSGDVHCSLLADADIDCDGSGGNPDQDPYFQPDTAYHHEGKPLNAYEIPYIVLPSVAITGVAEQVLGCRCEIYNRETGLYAVGLVGDIGPRFKVGELSVAMAKAVGLPSNPNTGGTSNFDQILYTWYPGQTVRLGEIKYALQSYHG